MAAQLLKLLDWRSVGCVTALLLGLVAGDRDTVNDVPTTSDLSEVLGIDWFVYEFTEDPAFRTLAIRILGKDQDESYGLGGSSWWERGDRVKVAIQTVDRGLKLRLIVLDQNSMWSREIDNPFNVNGMTTLKSGLFVDGELWRGRQGGRFITSPEEDDLVMSLYLRE